MNCVLCQLPLNLPWGICSQCFQHLPHCITGCSVCGLPLFNQQQSCYHCHELKPNWQRLIAVADYKAPFTKLIYQFKSAQKTAFSFALARLMFLAWYQQRLATGIARPDIVTCVPLHRSRYWSRGYNQSALLAKHIAHWLAADFQPHLILCNVKKQDQKTLSKIARQRNVASVFECHSNLTGKTIAVIDDIVTTGHTINAVSKQLRLQGARYIQILCLCRTSL